VFAFACGSSSMFCADASDVTSSIQSMMSQFICRASDKSGLLLNDSHLHTVPVVSGAVQFPTPMSLNSAPSLLAPNIDNPPWQHASVLSPTSVSSAATLASGVTFASGVSAVSQWPTWQPNNEVAALVSAPRPEQSVATQ